MADSMFGGDYFLDAGVEVKQEPSLDFGSISASVPIPQRRTADLADLRDLNVDLDLCVQDTSTQMFHSHNSICNKFGYDLDMTTKNESFKMDNDDIFQVDAADLIQGPTLAELNANDDTLLDDLNFDDLLLPEENSYYLHIGGAMAHGLKRHTPSLRVQPPVTPQPSPATPSFLNNYSQESAPSSPFDLYGSRGQIGAFSPSSQHSSASSIPPVRSANLQELILRMDGYPGDVPLGQSVPATTALPSIPTRLKPPAARLSTSAPTHLTLEQIWQRREPRKHLTSTSSLVEAGSVSSLSGGLLSPECNELSQDEEDKDAESDEDSDRYEDLSSEGDSDDDGPEHKQSRSASKKERFFWQYNVQAKGPKGQRLVLKTKLEDPHVLNAVTDPVFSPNCSVRGIKHSGKARKGDGNDLTPNPRKLFLIGKELDNLGRIINDMTPVSELPFNVRPKTRKEKNKLASRACRLKKKAQHEANKLKLYGLEQEHRRLISGIAQMKQIIGKRVTNQRPGADLNTRIESVVKSATKVKIAGQSSEFVNTVLDNVKSGHSDGGLEEVV